MGGHCKAGARGAVEFLIVCLHNLLLLCRYCSGGGGKLGVGESCHGERYFDIGAKGIRWQ